MKTPGPLRDAALGTLWSELLWPMFLFHPGALTYLPEAQAQAIWSSCFYPGLYGKPPFTSSPPPQSPFLRGDRPATWLENAKQVLKGKLLALECGEHAGVG